MLSPCNTIILETLPGDPMLNVVQKKTKHMGSMGVPTRNGHKMHIEEALFLVQCRKAMIRHQGTPLRLQECMYLLESCSLPLNKFTVYKNLKNLGHMIRISEEGFYDLFAAEGYSMSNKKLKPTCRVVYCPSADMTSDDLVNLVKKASEGTSAKIVLAKIRNGICSFVCAATGMIFEP
ncbi:hypothetical protein L596_029583 [Steinernema carpocapsae]|uniref:tRNA-splicing endonuclease subunit Sen54 N-terminal domain-containing protein n=1 Tax=Steinernema carpocapsae TaxID=34508 RepID=A0A4U5LV28_STECR|nr:hypothetical protein L596_029583 [Steinernema carpocapsae]